jgi:hypothetical protein
MSAVDSAAFGGMPRNAVVGTFGTGGTAIFSTNHQVGSHALSLTTPATLPTANGGYVTLPTSLQSLAPTNITLAVWVRLTANSAAQNWERIFDFGLNATVSMYLTARAGDGANPIRFAITTTGHALGQEQRLDGPGPLTVNAWHHIAIVLPAGSPYTGTLYIDGAAVATNPAMTLHAADVGATIDNHLGRSQFTADPFFNGFLDDFRVYRRALTSGEITALYMIR